MRAFRLVFVGAAAAVGCYAGIESSTANGDSTSESGSDATTDTGDGDGDSATSDPSDGDGDGDPSGDGDGDGDADGDGDGEAEGDGDGDSTTGEPDGCTPDALELIDLVNDYRSQHSLPAIPASPSLCTVSTHHVHDLFDNAPHMQGDCNLHSWSARGPWTPCCYTPDHAAAQCMWDKPGELTIYPGYGYENAAFGVGSPAQALGLWQSSPPHNEVILNQGIWADNPWQAIGADIYQGYAVLWFGVEPDPAR